MFTIIRDASFKDTGDTGGLTIVIMIVSIVKPLLNRLMKTLVVAKATNGKFKGIKDRDEFWG